MPWFQKLLREPALVTGVLTAAFGLVAALGLPLSSEQVGVITVFAGSVMALLRYVLVPASEVVAQQKPGGAVVATASAEKNWGLDEGSVVSVDFAEAA